jgi:hypothetical protein
LADLEAQFQALRRLVASKVGFAAFTMMPGWVEDCLEAHELSPYFTERLIPVYSYVFCLVGCGYSVKL